MTFKEFRFNLYNEVAEALFKTTETYEQISVRFGISTRTVYDIAKARNIKRKPGPRKKAV
jgi:hypothetical protein